MAELAREKEMAELKKENIDDNMQRFEALETAQRAFSEISFATMRVS
jgi:hypothetical protein